MLNEVGVTIPDQALIMQVDEANDQDKPNEEDEEQAKQMTLAVKFIQGTNAHC